MEKVIWALPTTVEVNGTTYPIQSDYRAILDILVALTDRELDERDKAEAALTIFYPGFDEMPVSDYQEALNQCFRFIMLLPSSAILKMSRTTCAASGSITHFLGLSGDLIYPYGGGANGSPVLPLIR